MKTILNRTLRGRDNIKPRQIYAEKIKQNQRKTKSNTDTEIRTNLNT